MLSDSKIIEIFYMADDFCKFFNETVKKHSIEDGKKHRNKPSRLSDAEMITILIMFRWEYVVTNASIVTRSSKE